MTTVLVVMLVVAVIAMIVQPLLLPSATDPLPDPRDPIVQDLEEERDALLMALRELDARPDLADDRRSALRARYEAKTAKVLRALDERRAELAGRHVTEPVVGRRAASMPWTLAVTVAAMATIAASLGGFVLPRIGQNATVTSFFESDLALAERARDREAEARTNPSGLAWASVGDVYWEAQDAVEALAAYERATNDFRDAPARAYVRQALLLLEVDLARATILLEEARRRSPDDVTTLATLGEVYAANGEYADALDAYERLIVVEPAAADDPVVQESLTALRILAPLARAAETDPSAETLRALADAAWDAGAREAAIRAYLRLLQTVDGGEPIALARLGEVLFLDGRNDEALVTLDRAAVRAAERGVTLPPSAWLFLGNASFTAERYDDAIEAWSTYVDVAEDPGRVPGLIERAVGLRDGTPVADTSVATAAPSAAADYAQYCAACHGVDGGGGVGPRLVGNRNAGRYDNVVNLVTAGRGSMPGFRAVLDEARIEALASYVTTTFAP